MQWNEPYVHVETVDIMSVRRSITLPKRYMPGQGDLIVFYNGVYAIKGKDYDEISPFSVEFKYDLEPEDTVVFHYQKLW